MISWSEKVEAASLMLIPLIHKTIVNFGAFQQNKSTIHLTMNLAFDFQLSIWFVTPFPLSLFLFPIMFRLTLFRFPLLLNLVCVCVCKVQSLDLLVITDHTNKCTLKHISDYISSLNLIFPLYSTLCLEENFSVDNWINSMHGKQLFFTLPKKKHSKSTFDINDALL